MPETYAPVFLSKLFGAMSEATLADAAAEAARGGDAEILLVTAVAFLGRRRGIPPDVDRIIGAAVAAEAYLAGKL